MSQQPRSPVWESSAVPEDLGDISVDTRPLGDHLLLVVSGEADSSTAEVLAERLRRALTPTTRSVDVDVSRLEFCDLAGLDALDGFCAETATRQVPTTVLGMSPLVTWLREVFVPLYRPTGTVARTDA